MKLSWMDFSSSKQQRKERRRRRGGWSHAYIYIYMFLRLCDFSMIIVWWFESWMIRFSIGGMVWFEWWDVWMSVFRSKLLIKRIKRRTYKNIFSRNNLKEIMNYREGIIFKISSPHTDKIYIGCSSLPLKRAVSGLRASAKFRKLSCNILC